MKLKISNELSLPIEAVTQTFAILAKKGSGKSYCASVMAEEMLKAREQVIVIDPTGAWYGLQSSADGKNPGFPIVIFGGDHANVPLEENAGAVIAQAIVENNFSAIIDLSAMRKGAANRFMYSFLETLYQINRDPVHLFVDEADLFAPQKSFQDEARTLGAMEDIVRRGRRKGIGCTLITQRPAVINKNVLTQCEVLIALCLNHPKDIDAIGEWVNVHADKKQFDLMIKSLPTLGKGNAWVWSPGWINVFKLVQIRVRETFDSGATPKPGEQIRKPKKLASIDIVSLGKSIQDTVEKQKSENPAALKKKIAELERELNKKVPLKSIAPVVNMESERKLKHDLAEEKKRGDFYFDRYKSVMNVIGKIDGLCDVVIKHKDVVPDKKEYVISVSPINKTERKPEKMIIASNTSNNSTGYNLPKCERAVLTVLAQRQGLDSRKSQLGILSGYSSKTGGFNNALSNLRTQNLIEGTGDHIRITADGIVALGSYESLPTGENLHQYWYDKLSKCEAAILKCLIAYNGSGQTKEQIGNETGYSFNTGGFNNALSRLRTLELIMGYGLIKASDFLFE